MTGVYKKKNKKFHAMAGNRTRINCLEGNYADHYTTIAVEGVWSVKNIRSPVLFLIIMKKKFVIPGIFGKI